MNITPVRNISETTILIDTEISIISTRYPSPLFRDDALIALDKLTPKCCKIINDLGIQVSSLTKKASDLNLLHSYVSNNNMCHKTITSIYGIILAALAISTIAGGILTQGEAKIITASVLTSCFFLASSISTGHLICLTEDEVSIKYANKGDGNGAAAGGALILGALTVACYIAASPGLFCWKAYTIYNRQNKIESKIKKIEGEIITKEFEIDEFFVTYSDSIEEKIYEQFLKTITTEINKVKIELKDFKSRTILINECNLENISMTQAALISLVKFLKEQYKSHDTTIIENYLQKINTNVLERHESSQKEFKIFIKNISDAWIKELQQCIKFVNKFQILPYFNKDNIEALCKYIEECDEILSKLTTEEILNNMKMSSLENLRNFSQDTDLSDYANLLEQIEFLKSRKKEEAFMEGKLLEI